MSFDSIKLPIKCSECEIEYKILDKLWQKFIVKQGLRYICDNCKSDCETNFI